MLWDPSITCWKNTLKTSILFVSNFNLLQYLVQRPPTTCISPPPPSTLRNGTLLSTYLQTFLLELLLSPFSVSPEGGGREGTVNAKFKVVASLLFHTDLSGCRWVSSKTLKALPACGRRSAWPWERQPWRPLSALTHADSVGWSAWTGQRVKTAKRWGTRTLLWCLSSAGSFRVCVHSSLG